MNNHLVSGLFLCFFFLLVFDLSLIEQSTAKEHTEKEACSSVQYKFDRSSQQCLFSDGLKREYRLYVPENRVKKPGLIIALHGGGSSARILENYSALNTLSHNNKQFIVVYPQALDKHWNDGRALSNNQNFSQSNDVQFINDLIVQMKQFNIDPSKIGI